MTPDEQAQVIGYFAALPECPVVLYLNFGRPRLEIHRLVSPDDGAGVSPRKVGNATGQDRMKR